MEDSNKISDMIHESLKGIKDLVDVNTVIGDPITTPDGTTIIPVSKVSMGFASGGLDYFAKKNGDAQPEKQTSAQSQNPSKGFGGGGGTGMSVSPLGFLVIKPDGDVELLNISAPTVSAPDTVETISSLVDRAPDIIERLKAVFKGKKSGDKAPDDGDNQAYDGE